MMRPLYRVTIDNVGGGKPIELNSWFYVSGGLRKKALNKLTIYIDRDLSVPMDMFRIRIATGTGTLLDQDPVSIKAEDIKPGATVRIYLGYNDKNYDRPVKLEDNDCVFTGLVDEVSQDFRNIVITGYSNVLKIISKKPEAFDSKQASDADSKAIIKALLGRIVELDDPFVQNGMKFHTFVPNTKKSIYDNIKLLAEYNGFDLYFSKAGKLRFCARDDPAPLDLKYAVDILDNSTTMSRPPFDSVAVVVCHAIDKSEDVNAWRITDEPLRGASLSGQAKVEVLQRQSAIIKDQDSAKKAAQNKLARLYAPESGQVTIPGKPGLELGQKIKVDYDNAPEGLRFMGKNAVRVTRITHKFNMRSGFVTIVGWTRPPGQKDAAWMGKVKPTQKISEKFSYGLEDVKKQGAGEPDGD